MTACGGRGADPPVGTRVRLGVPRVRHAVDPDGVGVDAGPPIRYSGRAVVGDGWIESSFDAAHTAAVATGAEGELVAVEDRIVGPVQGTELTVVRCPSGRAHAAGVCWEPMPVDRPSTERSASSRAEAGPVLLFSTPASDPTGGERIHPDSHTRTAGLIEAGQAHRAEAGDDYWDESCVAGAFNAPGKHGDRTLVLGFEGGPGIATPCLETLRKGSWAWRTRPTAASPSTSSTGSRTVIAVRRSRAPRRATAALPTNWSPCCPTSVSP